MKPFLHFVLAAGLLLTATACQINRTKNHERVGKWVTTMSQDDQLMTIRAKYNRKGLGKGSWRYHLDGKLYKREVYDRRGNCFVTAFHANGNTAVTGQTRLETNPSGIHWFYTGDWLYFDEAGTLTRVSHYKHGALIRETQIEKK
ncbi:hypothetical protein [Flavobacterium sp. JP2137]|uniref:hypothetical protein n=1 Tax=Flavobacterium sp. JP2137 TaxID=3414510 RepID=UPI003D300097